jgi:hypothetical protein
VRLKAEELAEKEDKGRGLWKIEILPSLGRKCRSLGGATSAIGSADRTWTVEGSSRPGKSRRIAREEMAYTVRI